MYRKITEKGKKKINCKNSPINIKKYAAYVCLFCMGHEKVALLTPATWSVCLNTKVSIFGKKISKLGIKFLNILLGYLPFYVMKIFQKSDDRPSSQSDEFDSVIVVAQMQKCLKI